MNTSQFKEMAIYSAQLYYQFLAENGLGISTTLVSKITPVGDMFLLDLKTRLSRFSMEHLDSLMFRFQGSEYNSNKIAPLEYDARKIELLVKPRPEFFPEFSMLSPDDLSVVSDLKFLVKRVEVWYSNYGNRICFPTALPDIAKIVYPEGTELSPEQKAAISGVFSSPLSYVWGAPGTGKTRVVLSSCILSLLRSGQRVLLLAPTNNALEQVLYGVLPILQNAGISLDCVERYGAPSSEFAKKYPSVCEFSKAHIDIQEISFELDRIEKYQRFVSFKNQFDRASGRTTSLLEEMNETVSNLLLLDKDLTETKRGLADVKMSEHLLHQEENRLSSQIVMRERGLNGFGPLKRLFFAKQYEAEKIALHALRTSFSGNSSKILQTIRERKSLVERTELIMERQNALNARFNAMCEELSHLTEFWPLLHRSTESISVARWSEDSNVIMQAFKLGQETLSMKADLYSDCIATSPEILQAKYDELLALKERTSTSTETTSSQRKELYLIAATLDRYLADSFLNEGFHPNHIFLDEAAYCSLIKAASALSLHVPVTLLGDHMQLPPVCEMNDERIQSDGHSSVCLWCQSAAHLERIFSDDPQQILDSYLSGEAAPFDQIDKFDLDCTFRFGDSLADILADTVYSPAFHSGSPGGTELLVLDAPKSPGASPRTSPAEVTAIKDYLSQFPLEDFAVITPYRKQLALLSSAFSRESKDERILTVHASQGREWDTVFFSVVDSTNKWFTDSCNSRSKGKMVINTAISRVRKRLILVCDYNYWVTQNDQLLGQIAKAATKINSGELPSPLIKK